MRIVWKQGKRGTERCTMRGAWLTARPNGKWSVCVQELDPVLRERVAGIWTINEVRAQRGLDPLPGRAGRFFGRMRMLSATMDDREVHRGRAKPRTLVAAKEAAEGKLRALLAKRELRRQRLQRERQQCR